MDGMKFGLEAEYALVRPDGRFADFTNTAYAEAQALIDPLPDLGHPELRVGDAGIRVKNWYVEGDERFDEEGRSTGLAFKGIEVRTPATPSIEEAMRWLRELRAMVADAAASRGWSLAAIGFNPCTAAYEPDYTAWEKAFHLSHIDHSAPEVSTLSYGPDLNLSRAGDADEEMIAAVRRLTFYSPYIVPFSFGSPFVGGEPWDGLSYRTYRRTGPRPAALAHLSGGHSHPLAKEADPPSQAGRIEFKAFDMVGDDRLLAELFRLVLGVVLADARALPGAADLPDAALHAHVARAGFDDDRVRAEAARVVATAQDALRAAGEDDALPLLAEIIETRRTPAHAMRERFLRTGSFFAPPV